METAFSISVNWKRKSQRSIHECYLRN